MSDCSLITVTNGTGKKIWQDRYTNVAETAGMKFIELQHIDEYGTTEIGIRGFQGAEIFTGVKKGGKKNNAIKWEKDEDGNDAKSPRQLFFAPDEESGALRAWCPDSELNRRVIARSYYHNPQFTIVDKEIDKEIRSLAVELDAAQKKEDGDKIVVSSPEIEALQNELALERRKRIEAEKKTEVETQDVKDAETERLNDKALRKIVRDKVHAENQDIIEEIKQKNPKGWHLSTDYQEKIAPLVKKELEERLLNANASTVSSNN